MSLGGSYSEKASKFRFSYLKVRVALGNVIDRKVNALLKGYVGKETFYIKRDQEFTKRRQRLDVLYKSESVSSTMFSWNVWR